MKVKINKCSSPLYWYLHSIGKIYDVLKEVESPYGKRYKVLDGDTFKFINFHDASVLNERSVIEP